MLLVNLITLEYSWNSLIWTTSNRRVHKDFMGFKGFQVNGGTGERGSYFRTDS